MPSLLRDSADVRRILIAFAVNRLGSFLGLIALLVAVFDHTKDALAVSGLLLAWQALPAFAVPALVARVEASSHGRELGALYVFEAVATAALAFFVAHFWLPAILVLAALDGTAALAASALLRAALARAARGDVETPEGQDGQASAERERSANAVLNVAFSVTFVLGPALGGVLVAAVGAPWTLLLDVASFVACGLLLMPVRTHIEEAGGDSVRSRLAGAWLYVRRQATLRSLLITYGIALALFETAAPIEVAFAKTTLGAGDRGLGLLLTAWGIGAVVGSLLFARMTHRSLGLMLTVGTLAIGVADAGFALSPNLGLACLSAVIGGLGNGIELPALMSLVQGLAPSDMHGRVIGAVESITALSLAVGLPLGGALVAVTTTRAAFSGVAIATVATAFVLAYLSRPAQSAPKVQPVQTSGTDLAGDLPSADARRTTTNDP